MQKTQAEYGRIGGRRFWKKFKENTEFRERIIKSRKSCKGTMWIKRASMNGVAARLKKYKEEEKIFLSKKKNKEYFSSISRLCGFLIGDGCLVKNSFEIAYYPDDIVLAEMFVSDFSRVYGKKPRIKNLGKYFRVRIRLKLAHKHLSSITSFNSLEWKIPKKILASEANKIEFIRSFFDCEAYVGKKVIQVQSVNFRGLNSIKDLLKELDIVSKIYRYKRKNKNWNINYILCIMKKEDRANYLNTIGFNHPLKQNKLINSLARVA